ncbi:hypothetical protein FE697_004095 [Mumia zhuanghuii]|uniref:Fenitrothion hydrolase n=2 Tax=Mumia TaxID=1546255 RepID=A0ABW1QTD5_9ACTN|nr:MULTISPECIES: hypothetical protein [Mumia]KAA1425071.1 hypothetical protein FE697_004095 [Mumia zhuanghuii]
MTPSRNDVVVAHGIGGSTDLPVPLEYAMLGATWALAISFAVLALAWRRPKLDPRSPGAALPPWVTRAVDGAATHTALGVLGVAITGWVALAAFGGEPGPTNGAPGAFYVLLWVGLVPLSLVCGHVWAYVSPVRALHHAACRALRRDPATGVWTYPERLGYWPAALGLLAFVWTELASPDPGALTTIRVWLVGYVVAGVLGGLAFGRRWFERADPFDVYAAFVAALSPFGRRDPASSTPQARRVVARNPLSNLAGLPVDHGIVAVVAVLLGSTAFDSATGTSWWLTEVQTWYAGSPVLAVAYRSLGLLAAIGAVGAVFVLAARATGGVTSVQRRELPSELAHSLVPIVVGYVGAHYLTYLVEKGQRTLIALADPLDRGWDPLGIGGLAPSYWLSEHPHLLAVLKVGLVLTGHVLGVIAAHDRCIRLLPRAHHLTGQLALMLVMVGYTFLGLFLLFAG